ncbi:ribonuclease Z [Desulfosporosinus meridiei]|uniref:Ribonuclease Z n=1 Tax=Desulfosporosinus meridiei (strain ATCC BAA-275 / DSM 13257 / KCTC 12902 / NCIMB 13706 / S10) TaxID=768704 RepID=J7ISZ4_DESMD|nr:ribonuclease Z [Desulfosporosinus meridiei]AFQ44795.1 RNAse Z [Desulfosporosinus meridiei DSM 13257]
MLDVCLLGTGGMMPLPNRWLSSLLLRSMGRMLLIDCGEGTQIPLRKIKWGFKGIDVILFTHYHADHISGLPGILLSIGNSGRKEPLTLMGPPGIQKVVDCLTVISPGLPYDLSLIELSDTNRTTTIMSNIEIKSIPVEHTLPCLAFSIEFKRQGKFDVERASNLKIPLNYWNSLQKGQTITWDGKIIKPEMVVGEIRKGIKVSYCTDTRPTNSLVQFISESDLLVCEGMYGKQSDLRKAEQKKHMLFSEAGLIAKLGRVKELWLTHYSPSLTSPEEYIDLVKSVFPNTILGQDLLTKTINYFE